MAGRRRFGRVRRLASGRWQARFPGPDGIDRPAPDTFATKTDADIWLPLKEAEIRSGDWIDPDAGTISFEDYAKSWVAERPNLRPKSVQLYEGLTRLHLIPVLSSLGVKTVADVKEGTVRRWRRKLLDSGLGPVTVAKAYRLLVLLAVFCSLRWGELAALPRNAIDQEHGIVSVRASVVELARGPLVTGPPKSAAGRRDVTIPAFLLPDVAAHLDDFTAANPRSLVFTGPKGAQLRRSNFTRAWVKATEAAGLSGFHFHDLRQTGNQMAGNEGASLRELMERMGHSSPRAALIYQHRTMHRDKIIADAMGKRAEAVLNRSGTQRAHGQDKGV